MSKGISPSYSMKGPLAKALDGWRKAPPEKAVPAVGANSTPSGGPLGSVAKPPPVSADVR